MQEADTARNELSRLREQLNTEIEARNKAQVISVAPFVSHDRSYLLNHAIVLGSRFDVLDI